MSNIDRKTETKIVKEALKKAGIIATVKHGKGTSWGWLRVNIGESARRNGVNPETRMYTQEEQDLHRKVIKIVQEVTGRHGEYNGNINILTQD
jgi:hypothetical protein